MFQMFGRLFSGKDWYKFRYICSMSEWFCTNVSDVRIVLNPTGQGRLVVVMRRHVTVFGFCTDLLQTPIVVNMRSAPVALR